MNKFKSCFEKCFKSDAITPKSQLIQHIVVLVLENRSFDQVFGYRNDYPPPLKVRGIKNCNSSNETDRIFNLDKDGNKVYQNKIKAFTGHDEVAHDLKATLWCINGKDQKTPGSMDGFVISNDLNIKDDDNAEKSTPLPSYEIMGYFPEGSFPMFEYIANNFTICDNWFASAPTCTQPNRVFGLCGTAQGHIDNRSKGLDPKLFFTCDTIFDRLNDKDLSWKVYYNDIPSSLLLEHQLKPKNLIHYHEFEKFDKDIKNGDLPVFSFIEPEFYFESSAKKIENVNNGQNLVMQIIKSLKSNDDIWNSTIFIIYMDENGGFFDGVNPPKAIPPTTPLPGDKYTFDQYGLRVPAMIVGGRVPKGVDSTLYDHTSVLNFMEQNWNLEPLTERDKAANNFSKLILKEPRTDIPEIPLDIEKQFNYNSTTFRSDDNDKQFVDNLIKNTLSHITTDTDIVLRNANINLYNNISRWGSTPTTPAIPRL